MNVLRGKVANVVEQGDGGIKGVNPACANGQGRFSITDQGDSLLEGIGLGARHLGWETEACGHRLRPRSQG